MRLKDKKITLSITGSIAAYKAASLIRLLVKEGAEVRVLMTTAAKEFITPLTLSTLSKHPVQSDFFVQANGQWNSHVDMGLWADLMLIAPASANTIAKMAHGIADNLVLTAYLSAKCPVLVAPAMDLDMYKHPSTLANLALLRAYGNSIIESQTGELASGLMGKGRMEEPALILEQVCAFLSDDISLKGKKVMITAGPTYEKIDPVRFIGNFSSGKMGYALAEECAKRGAEVTLISGPVALREIHPRIKKIAVVSAQEMYDAVLLQFPFCDCAILCAAVADFTPTPALHKMKSNAQGLSLELHATQDIAKKVGQLKKKHQLLVGFALETDQGLEAAHTKLNNKNLDLIVLNSISDPGAGFMTNTNQVTLIDRDGNEERTELKTKKEIAMDIISAMQKRMNL